MQFERGKLIYGYLILCPKIKKTIKIDLISHSRQAILKVIFK